MGRKLTVYVLAAFLAAPGLFAGGPNGLPAPRISIRQSSGQPVHWAGGVVRYYIDKGPLNSQISHQQASAIVDAAAALWSAVPTAGLVLINPGSLSEDVSSANVITRNQAFAQLSDVTPSATDFPLAVVFDSDGSVTNGLFGAGASDPTSCQNNGVFTWLDNIRNRSESRHIRRSRSHHTAPPRYERESNGRWNGHSMSGTLRVGTTNLNRNFNS